MSLPWSCCRWPQRAVGKQQVEQYKDLNVFTSRNVGRKYLFIQIPFIPWLLWKASGDKMGELLRGTVLPQSEPSEEKVVWVRSIRRDVSRGDHQSSFPVFCDIILLFFPLTTVPVLKSERASRAKHRLKMKIRRLNTTIRIKRVLSPPLTGFKKVCECQNCSKPLRSSCRILKLEQCISQMFCGLKRWTNCKMIVKNGNCCS